MKKIKSTVGLVSSEGVMLKDDTIFKNGDLVIVISAESFDDFYKTLSEFKENIDKSKKWIDEVKKIKENVD